MKFSVLLSIYIKENPIYLDLSLKSIFNQTTQPNEVILVLDGPISKQLNEVILLYQNCYPEIFNILKLSKNVGLGNALNIGLKHVSNEIVARMDTDDLCYPDRFEKQIDFLLNNPEVSVVGGTIQEFNKSPGDLNQYRRLPLNPYNLYEFAKYRNPLSHPSVMFRKADVLNVGSYHDMPLFEDYYLWIRMLINGYKIANINEPILHFRVGNDMIGRRSGISYAKKEIAFLKAIKKLGFLSEKDFFISIVMKVPLRILPKKLLRLLYKKLLR